MSAPSRLGRYPVRRRLGAGAFATVWLAYDEHLDSEVAIKVLADNWTEDLHVRQRFVEEGRFLRKVESPHVVNVYDAGELSDGRPFLVMSYADQGTLADRLELGRLSPAQALHVVDQVGQGLDALHARGVLHRDVKPANVLFRTVDRGRSGQEAASEVCAMLGDLGLGKAMDMSSRLTMIGGTPTFVAPEQARGEALDARADQYSLAALAYLLLTGRAPFDHQTLTAAADPEPPAPLDHGFPDEADAVVRRALSPRREERYDDVPSFVAALAATLGEQRDDERMWTPTATRIGPHPGTDATEALRPDPASDRAGRPRWHWLAAGALALVVGAGAGWAVERAVSTERDVDDETGTISVTVPEEWASVDAGSWTPPGADAEFASISAGTRPGWNSRDRPAPGVFAGLLPGDELPTDVPPHPECETRRDPVSGSRLGDATVTVVFTGCEGPGFTVERVVQLNASELLWIQVRSEDRPTANRVLDQVDVRGK
ncbi:serine/threonine protein kinase [Nocardioides seonyuensis]|uniref:non-specific serine/threonine protein kinase n=1 Tax=Nocardioides seonyuensis TaxID=2518371 RepID=A0A4P7IER1_9ACTN|nr:serine/threonine-protein kinase [Nocardioides seonyuensis]QBX55648.1 serine/threonine protein kinase [Nocardioides seonyuensis]